MILVGAAFQPRIVFYAGNADRGWKAASAIYTVFHKNIPAGISGCGKKR
jgi:hypothetical protein